MAPELNRKYDLLDSAGLHYCSFGFIRAVNLHMKSWMKFFGHRIEVLGTLFFTHFCWRQWNWRDNTAIQTWTRPLWMIITFEYMWSLLRPLSNFDFSSQMLSISEVSVVLLLTCVVRLWAVLWTIQTKHLTTAKCRGDCWKIECIVCGSWVDRSTENVRDLESMP